MKLYTIRELPEQEVGVSPKEAGGWLYDHSVEIGIGLLLYLVLRNKPGPQRVAEKVRGLDGYKAFRRDWI